MPILAIMQTNAYREVLTGTHLENEAEAAAETARRLYQQDAPSVGKRQRQVTLREQVAQIGAGFHAPRQRKERRDGLSDVDVQTGFRTNGLCGIELPGSR